jgi:hypothetical protein
MIERYRDYIILGFASIITTIILWLPFFLRLETFWGIDLRKEGMATIVANYDGPYYIVAAKSLYDPEIIQQSFNFNLEPIYYSAHYPLFPLLIRGVATAFPFLGYPYAMMLVTIITSVFAIWMFYTLLVELGLKKQALWLSLLFTIFPARWLIVRSIGSPEPLFLATILSSIYFFKKEKWWLAGIFGALAQLTKPPAILLFLSYGIAILAIHWPRLAHTQFFVWFKELKWKAYPIFLMPISLLALYIFYGIRYHDYLAYFNSGDNIHLQFPPFQVFNPGQPWVGTPWLEEIIWLYLFGALGFLYLVKQKQILLASFVGVFFLSLLFVAHRDIARYSLPITPFLLIAFSKLLTSREFKFVLVLLIIPIYLFSIAFITNNVTPIGDWSPLL